MRLHEYGPWLWEVQGVRHWFGKTEVEHYLTPLEAWVAASQFKQPSLHMIKQMSNGEWGVSTGYTYDGKRKFSDWMRHLGWEYQYWFPNHIAPEHMFTWPNQRQFIGG